MVPLTKGEAVKAVRSSITFSAGGLAVASGARHRDLRSCHATPLVIATTRHERRDSCNGRCDVGPRLLRYTLAAVHCNMCCVHSWNQNCSTQIVSCVTTRWRDTDVPHVRSCHVALRHVVARRGVPRCRVRPGSLSVFAPGCPAAPADEAAPTRQKCIHVHQ